jgi:hypothetical protein
MYGYKVLCTKLKYFLELNIVDTNTAALAPVLHVTLHVMEQNILDIKDGYLE